jgi:hypothetical protein
MLRLNKEGFLNGHTPFSALVAFSSVLTAYVNGIENVALSNENSANEATIAGTDINHQYSKSFEFESDFIKYEREFIDSGVSYFSLLRPLSEIAIAKIFSRYEAYHSVFRSCNLGSKENRWCGVCAKCLFVYIILAPFLPTEKLVEIFGKDLFTDESLIPIMHELTGQAPEKPFECVGSRDEACAALLEVKKQYSSRGEPLPPLIAAFAERYSGENYDLEQMCAEIGAENNVPIEFLTALKEIVNG